MERNHATFVTNYARAGNYIYDLRSSLIGPDEKRVFLLRKFLIMRYCWIYHVVATRHGLGKNVSKSVFWLE